MTEFLDRYGRWAIIAGASEGTGASFSRQIAAHGVNVVLVARRPEPLAALADQIREASGVQTRTVSIDLSRPDADRALVAATEGLEVGLLIYNAGADEYGMKFLDVEVDDWVAMVQRNCVFPLRLSHHFARAMVDRGRGGILLVTSAAAWAGGDRLATYCATKAFDLVFGEALWAELSPKGVDVLSFVLGATDTPAFRALAAKHGTTVGDIADADEVARDGLEHLADGPTWTAAALGGGDASLVGAMPRRDAVQLMSAGMSEIVGEP
ncbi:MAG: SDR family NAD(P)-dependent oxidoreductase [Acidimicrobiia bacterium]